MFVDFNILNQLGSPSINSNTFANRPAAGQTGRLFVSTDTYEIYRDNGSTWDLIGGPGSSTITGTGTATQVAYFTSAQAIGSSANLFFDDTNNRLGVGTSAPAFTIEANGDILAEAIYLDGATSGNGALYWTSDRVTLANYNASGIVHIETAGGAAAATFGADLTATITSGIGTRGFTGSTSYAGLFNGSVGVNTATPGAALDVHSTGTIAQFNTTSGSGNTYISWQRAGTGLWRLGDTYNGGSNFFELHNTTLAIDALEFEAATNKSTFQATQTYTTGLARANYLDYNLSVAAGGSFSSPNAITALGASLDLSLAGNATIPSGARSGLDAYNSVSFTGTGTLTHSQGTQIRAYSNLTTGWAFSGSATGTITHLAGMRVLFPDNTGSAVSVTNNYALLINDQTANTGTVTYTNRFGIYQEGASDTNYFAATTLVGTNVNSGYKFEVSGSANATTLFQNGVQVLTTAAISGTTNYIPKFTSSSAIGNSLIYDNGTNVGIGTTSPGQKLTADAPYGQPATTGTTQNGVFRIQVDQGVGWGEVFDMGMHVGISGPPSYAWLQGTNKGNHGINYNIAINPRGGNVGIGTTSPTSLLHLHQSGANTIFRIGNNAAFDQFIYFNGNNDWSLGIDYSNSNAFVLSNFSSIGTNDRLVITSGGNVLIGTTTDSGFKVDINGTGRFSGGLYVSGGSGGDNGLLIYQAGGGASLPTYNANSDRAQLAFKQAQNFPSSNNYTRTLDIVSTGDGTGGGMIRLFTTVNNSTPSAALTLSTTGAATFSSSVTTGAPSGGTAAAWKFGERVASAGVTLNDSQYIQLDVGGTTYYLATVNTS